MRNHIVVTLMALIATVLLGCATHTRPSDSVTAQGQVAMAQAKAGNSYTCWAEDNTLMPEGFEILCRYMPH